MNFVLSLMNPNDLVLKIFPHRKCSRPKPFFFHRVNREQFWSLTKRVFVFRFFFLALTIFSWENSTNSFELLMITEKKHDTSTCVNIWIVFWFFFGFLKVLFTLEIFVLLQKSTFTYLTLCIPRNRKKYPSQVYWFGFQKMSSKSGSSTTQVPSYVVRRKLLTSYFTFFIGLLNYWDVRTVFFFFCIFTETRFKLTKKKYISFA